MRALFHRPSLASSNGPTGQYLQHPRRAHQSHRNYQINAALRRLPIKEMIFIFCVPFLLCSVATWPPNHGQESCNSATAMQPRSSSQQHGAFAASDPQRFVYCAAIVKARLPRFAFAPTSVCLSRWVRFLNLCALECGWPRNEMLIRTATWPSVGARIGR